MSTSVLAILEKDTEGEFRRVERLELSKGQGTLVVPMGDGVVIVVGQLCDADFAALNAALEAIHDGG